MYVLLWASQASLETVWFADSSIQKHKTAINYQPLCHCFSSQRSAMWNSGNAVSLCNWLLDGELNRFRRPKSRFCWYIQHWRDPGNSWFNRVQPIIIKVSRTVQLIEKLRHFLPTPTLLNIYQALIAPYLTYGLTVWGQACKSYLDKLLKLQKRALRFIYFSDHNKNAIPLFVDAHILPPNFVYYESIANLMFDVRNRTAPSNIQDLFKDISNVHSYNPFKRIPSLE